jgi:hypothetical protein
MRKTKQSPVDFEDPRFFSIYDCIRGGLRKLVRSRNLGWPAYTGYAVAISERGGGVSSELYEYVVASLWIVPEAREAAAACVLQYSDGDDWLIQRWRPLTYEEWCKQVDLYNEITYLDAELVEHLRKEGFT